MTDRFETLRAWFAPAMVVALAVQGVTGVSKINSIDNVAANAERSVTKVEARVQTLETSGVVSTAKMAVVESQLGSMLKMLERIDARMEVRANREGR